MKTKCPPVQSLLALRKSAENANCLELATNAGKRIAAVQEVSTEICKLMILYVIHARWLSVDALSSRGSHLGGTLWAFAYDM